MTDFKHGVWYPIAELENLPKDGTVFSYELGVDGEHYYERVMGQCENTHFRLTKIIPPQPTRGLMTKEEAKNILDLIESEELPEYEDIFEWLKDACKTIYEEDL